jgi:phage terminase large subunit GpA-like protein
MSSFVTAEPDQISAAEIYRRSARAGARPDPDLLVSEWADKHRFLTTRSSPEPGQWRTDRTPFLKAIMDDLSPRTHCQQVVFMKGSQIGGTECGNNWIGFVIHMAPGPMLAVQPTTDMAKRNSKQRIGPLIEESDVLRGVVREARARDSGNTVLAKEFPGGILVMTGANSAKGLRSMSARYLFLDEVDGYPGDVEGEGEPCDLAIARTSNYSQRKKIFIVSTPVLSGRSRIERFYNESDMRQFWVPCPKCFLPQVLRFEQLRWRKEDPDSAHYICEGCGISIPNHAKNWMLPRGAWIAQQPGSEIHGYHLSSLYSPVGWLSWAQIAKKYDEAGTDREKLQVFQNTILGQPWTDIGEVPDTDRLYERREAYAMGRVPYGGLLLVSGVDVQMKRLEVEIVAYGRQRLSWSIDYRVIEGDTTQPGVWAELAKLLDEDFETEYGGRVRITKMAIDSGFNTTAVYDFVRQMSPQRVMAVKGDSRVSSLIGAPSLIEVGPHGRMKYGIRLWPVNSSMAKEELYRFLRQAVPDRAAGEPWPTGFCHFPQYSKEYFEQLTAEQLVTRTHGGLRRTVWEKRRDRNEALDCRIYARAAAASLRFETWTAARWDDMEKALTVDRPQASALRSSISTTPVPEFKPIRSRDTSLD